MKSFFSHLAAGWLGYLCIGAGFAFVITFVSAIAINIFMRLFN